MRFTLQDPTSRLFWTSGIFGRVQLGATPNTYTLEGSYIKNTETGNYVNHRADLLHEGGEPEEFEFHEDGTITSQGKAVITGTFLHIGVSSGTPWIKVEEADDDVPVSRANALIEEALNASKKCGCECGCEAECTGCACEGCDCPKMAPAPKEPALEETDASSPQ